MNILQDISYVVASIKVILIFLEKKICGKKTFWDGEWDWPWNPLGQLQVKELAPSTHVPPFWQGDDRHSSKSRSHFFPGPQNVRSLHTLSYSDREARGTRPDHAHFSSLDDRVSDYYTHCPVLTWETDHRHSSRSRSYFFPGRQSVRPLHTLSCSDRACPILTGRRQALVQITLTFLPWTTECQTITHIVLFWQGMSHSDRKTTGTRPDHTRISSLDDNKSSIYLFNTSLTCISERGHQLKVFPKMEYFVTVPSTTVQRDSIDRL